MKTQTIEVPINLNGKLTLTAPSNGDPAKFAEYATQEMLKTLERLSEESALIDAFEGELWGDSGNVHVGNLHFSVEHDANTDSSLVNLMLQEKAAEGREASAKAMVKSYVAPDRAYVMAVDPKTDEEKELVMVSIEDGVLNCFIWDGNSEHASYQVSHPGFIMGSN